MKGWGPGWGCGAPRRAVESEDGPDLQEVLWGRVRGGGIKEGTLGSGEGQEVSQVPSRLSIHCPAGAGHWPPLRERSGPASRAQEGAGWTLARGMPRVLSAPPWIAAQSQA